MKHINTKEELQNHIAVKGDPVAFYSVFSDLFRSSYLSCIEKGLGDKEAQEILIKICVNVYIKFIRNRNEKTARTWFEKQVEKISGQNSNDNNDEIDLNQLGSNQLAEFERRLILEFQRIYSRYRSHGKVINDSIINGAAGKNRIWSRKVLYFSGLILVLFAVIELALIFFNSNLSLKFTRDDYMLVINLPLAFQKETDEKPEEFKGAETADSLVADSAEIIEEGASAISRVSFPSVLADQEQSRETEKKQSNELEKTRNVVKKERSDVRPYDNRARNTAENVIQKNTSVKKKNVSTKSISSEPKSPKAETSSGGEILKQETEPKVNSNLLNTEDKKNVVEEKTSEINTPPDIVDNNDAEEQDEEADEYTTD